MPLSTQALKTAQVDMSANSYLQPLWQAVNVYNATGGRGQVKETVRRFEDLRQTGKLPGQPSEMRQQALALQDIMLHAAGFLTCKPPNANKAKRHSRWDAMAQLMREVNEEAARIGVKLVDSPADFRTVDEHHGSVWLEVVDPRHRNFGALSKEYEKWAQDPKAEGKSFWNYIGDAMADDAVLYDKGAPSLVEKNLRGRFSEIQGHEVSTRGKYTLQEDGKYNWGWSIYAVTTDGRLHIGDHCDTSGERVRHTSLTGGEPALALGEISVIDGKISAISNLTGHYKLGAPQFLNWLATTPLLTPDVLVKARVGVTGEVVTSDERNPELKTTKVVRDHAIAASSVEKLREFVADGKPKGEFPFPYEWREAEDKAALAYFRDLRIPDSPGENIKIEL